MDFIYGNILLVLGVAGTVLTLIGSIIGAIAKLQKTSWILMVAVAICVVVTMQQVVSYNDAQQQEALEDSRRQQQELLEESRGILIEKIKENVVQTRITVDGIAAKLEKIPLGEIGTALVSIEDDPNRADIGRVLAFGKGSASMWQSYADWVGEVAKLPDTRACLSITINAGHHYVTGMLLAYLYTSDATQKVIEPVIKHGRWMKFPDAAFIKKFGLTTQGVRCLLVYDQDKNHLVGFASASQFANELMAFQQRGLNDVAEATLNSRHTDISQLQQRFPSISMNVLPGLETKQLVQQMLKEQIAEAAVLKDNRPYLLQLEKIIKLAVK